MYGEGNGHVRFYLDPSFYSRVIAHCFSYETMFIGTGET